MACFHPLTAYRSGDGSIVFYDRGNSDQIQLPCGQCCGCRLERSRQWAVRCVHESSMHSENCFVTLTYDSKFVPADGGLRYADFQLFMKRLRRRFSGRVIRFYMCGEYGENFSRPHFHVCLFGLDFPDRKLHSRSGSGNCLYRSAILEGLWPSGFSSVADFSFQTAAYVARYVMKKVNGQLSKDHYEVVDPVSGEVFDRSPEFCHMSLKPGIGAGWFAKYGLSDVVVRDAVVINGVEATVPKYYDKLLKRLDPLLYDDVKTQRVLDSYLLRDDNTPERLAAKKAVQIARTRSLRRSI